MVGCSSTEEIKEGDNAKVEESTELDTTKYFTDEGKEILEKNNKHDYEVIENFEPSSAWRYEDKKIQVTGKVAVIKDDPTKNTFEIHLVNNDNIIYVFIPKFLVNVNFKENDVITVKGVYRGLENHDGYEFQINGYIEIRQKNLKNLHQKRRFIMLKKKIQKKILEIKLLKINLWMKKMKLKQQKKYLIVAVDVENQM